METKEQLLKGLEDLWAQTTQVISNTDPEKFLAKPQADKWSVGEEFDHMLKTSAAYCSMLKRSHWALKWKFGRPNRPVRNYEQTLERYNQRLANLPPGAGSPIPLDDAAGLKQLGMLRHWNSTGNKFQKRVKKWRDWQLDSTLLPHPMMGKVLVREMLYFVHFHNLHHLQSIKNKLDVL